MAPPEQQPYDDHFLTRYLLGALPAAAAESMDVLCISDEELATRLAAIENDLVDAYVRGELAGDDLDQFKSFYLASPHRRKKAEFASALLEAEKKRASAPVALPTAAPQPVILPAPKPAPEPTAEPKAPVRPPLLRWGFALATAAVILVAAYVAFDNARLRRQVNDARSENIVSDQRLQQLDKELADQQAANAAATREIERLRQSQPSVEQLKTIAVLLPPPARGLSRPPTIAVQPGTDLAVLVLTLESDDFPQYRAELKDAAGDPVLWTSAALQSAAVGDKKTVSISFSAGLLKQQTYIIQLTGVPARGAAETIGSYAFRAVLK